MIYVRDLLKLDTFKNFELVSGGSGLNRSVSWPNIAQTVSIREWLAGGDVILMSGVGLEITDEFLKDIVVQAAQGGAACIIMLISPEHIAKIPEAVVQEAVDRGLALFAAPWETRLSKVIGSISMLVSNDRFEERIRNDFLDRLLAGEINREEEESCILLEKYGLLGKKTVVVIDYRFDSADLNNINHKNYAYHNERIMTGMIEKFAMRFDKVNYLNRYNSQVFILSAGDKDENEILAAVREIYASFEKESEGAQVRIGIGEITDKSLEKSFEQAKTAKCSVKEKGVLFYKELGIYQLLFYIDDRERIAEYVNKYLCPVIEYDKKYNQNLFETLREYLKNSQNLARTAQKLYIHRNTMIKRVEKLEDILGCSFKEADTVNQLYNAVKIYDLFNAEK